MAVNIVLAIIVTSLATYLSRFLGAFTSEKISEKSKICLLYTSPSPRDDELSRMPSSA